MEAVADRFAMGPIYLDGSLLWFSNLLYNGLLQYDFKNEKTQFIKYFPEEREGQLYLHRAILPYRDKLFFFPDQGRYIHIVNRESLEIESLDISAFCPPDRVCKISEAYRDADRMLLLPGNLDAGILFLDPDGLKIKRADFEIKVSADCKSKFSNLIWRSVKLGSHIYAPLYRTEYLIDIDLDKREITEKRIRDAMLYGVEVIDRHLWLYPEYGGKLYVLDEALNEIREIPLKQKPDKSRVLNGLVPWGDCVIGIPYSGGTFYRIGSDSVVEVPFTNSEALEENTVKMPSFRRTVCYGDELVFLPCKYANCIFLNRSDRFRVGQALLLKETDRKRLTKEILDDAVKSRYPIGEERYYTLEHYLDQIESFD